MTIYDIITALMVAIGILLSGIFFNMGLTKRETGISLKDQIKTILIAQKAISRLGDIYE